MTTEQLAPIRRLLEEALRQLGATENNDGAGKAQPGPPRHPKDEVTFDLVIAPNETHIEALRRVIRKELHYVSANKAFVDMRFRGYIRQLLDELDLAAPAAGEATPEKCPRCDSPKPHLHPAVQFEGEVQVCHHPFHSIRTNQNPPFDFDATAPGRRAPAQEPEK